MRTAGVAYLAMLHPRQKYPRFLPKLLHRCNFLPCASLRTAEAWTVSSDFNDSFWIVLAALFRGR
jgi:hypothetical protein